LLLPGGCTVEVGNHPSQAGEPYLGLALVFAQDSIDQFRRNYGAEIPDYTKPVWSAVAPKDMLTAMAQWIEWCAGEICQRLGIGQSTLRRRLNEEGAGFRQLLEESRMVVTLALLQEIFTHTTQYLFAAATLALTPLILGFELTSSDIQTGKPMPKTPEYQGFDCDRANISPQLSWRDAPSEGTKRVAITAYDPDAPTGCAGAGSDHRPLTFLSKNRYHSSLPTAPVTSAMQRSALSISSVAPGASHWPPLDRN
jgi:AraC-like DNA-binding protein